MHTEPRRDLPSERLVRHRWRSLAVTIAVIVAGALLNIAAGGSLVSGGFDDETSESARAADQLRDQFGREPNGVVFVVTPTVGTVDDPTNTTAGLALTERIAAEANLVQVSSYWTNPTPGLRSPDGDRALLVARIDLPEPDAHERARELVATYTTDTGTLSVALTGDQIISAEVAQRISRDLLRAEAIALPIAAILLIAFFRRVLIGLLPLLVGALVVIASSTALGLIAAHLDVSVFATNLVIALGLGLSIDYALLVTARYRDELAAGHPNHRALTRTLRTSGRTVIFSAATVAVALAALLVYPFTFLRSMALAGIIAATLAAVVTLLVLPALLIALGHRVTPRHAGAPTAGSDRVGIWGRIATRVMARPGRYAAATTIALLALVAPATGLRAGLPDDRNLPTDSLGRQAAEVIRNEFPANLTAPVDIVVNVATGATSTDRDTALSSYAAAISELPNVAAVDTATGTYSDGQRIAPPTQPASASTTASSALLTAVLDVDPRSPQAQDTIEQLRAIAPSAPLNGSAVGGTTALLVDTVDSLRDRTPLALAIIAAVTFLALFAMFGSLLVPLKAIALNLLSLTATFGAIVWVFQDGNLAGLFDITATGSITAAFPILIFCVAFGLSMDYEVFLIARINEHHDRTGDNHAAVVHGLDSTGRIITFAALLISVVFAGIATSSVANAKMLGAGLALAVLIDAFVIRTILVPAFMALAGNANWWAPAPLRRLHQHIALNEHVELDKRS